MDDYIITKCKQCGTLFKTDNPILVYCSEKCKTKSISDYHLERKRKENEEKYKDVPDIPTCKICGFKSPSLLQHIIDIHKMSAKTYKRKFKAKKHDIFHPSFLKSLGTYVKGEVTECIKCGSEFVKKAAREKYCSDKCRMEVRRERAEKQKTAEPTVLVEKECRYCGEKYMPKAYHSHYCSIRCRDRSYYEKRREKDTKKCRECGKEMTIHTKKKYCSKKCHDKTKNRKQLAKQIAKNNELYKDVPNIPTCKICGLKAKMLYHHVRKHHNLTSEQYCKKFKLEPKDLHYHKVTEVQRIKNKISFEQQLREHEERTKHQRTDKYQNDFFN